MDSFFLWLMKKLLIAYHQHKENYFLNFMFAGVLYCPIFYLY
jgi:hypothetical protein